MARRSRPSLPVIVRELAWTVHKRAPDRAGVGPLPTMEVALLKQIVDHPGATVGELSAALGLHQPNTSAALRVLVKRGLVTRATDANDRRSARVAPTELGVREHEAIATAWAATVATAISTLEPKHREALAAAGDAMVALTRLVRDLEG